MILVNKKIIYIVLSLRIEYIFEVLYINEANQKKIFGTFASFSLICCSFPRLRKKKIHCDYPVSNIVPFVAIKPDLISNKDSYNSYC